MALDMGVMRGQLLDSEASFSIAGTGDFRVAADVARNRMLELTGALTGNRSVILPVTADSAGKMWNIRNSTTGAYTVTVKGASGGSGLAIAQGETGMLAWDGDDFVGGITQIPSADVTADFIAVTGTVFPVEQQGAVGDGATDDAAAINAAIAAAVAAGGGTVTLNAGVYVVGAVIEIYDNVRLVGAGKEITTIKLKDATNGTFDVVTNEEATAGNDNFGVYNLKVDGNHANNLTHVGSCIHFYNSRDFDVINCHATGGNSAGGGTKGYGIGVEGALSARWRVQNCTATGNQRHGIATTSTPTHGLIAHNISHANTLEGIHVSTGDYVNIVGNTVYSNLSEGIGLTNAAMVSCIGNTCYDNLNGIAGVLGAKIIANNYLRENNQAGIALEATSNTIARTVISGNDLRANVEHGIQITKPGKLTIVGNVVTEVPATFDAINLSVLPTGGEPNRGVVITGNYLEGGGTGGVALAIDTAAFAAMIITNNYFHNGVDLTAGVPTGSLIRNNIGLVTEAKGTATILNTTTTIAVTHGLGITPTLGDINVNLNEAIGTGGSYWIADPTSTDFDLHVAADPGADITFSWSARII